MPGTNYTTNLRLSNPSLGDTGWGSTVSNGMIDLTDQAIAGQASVDVSGAGPFVLTMPDGTPGDARNMFLRFTGTPGGAREVQVPTNRKLYFVTNDSDGAVTVKVSGQTGVVVPVGASMALRINAAGTDVVQALTYQTALSIGTPLPVASGGTGITSFGTGVATALGQNVTGSGGIVLATNPSIDGATFTGNAQTTPVAVPFSATAMTLNCEDSNVFTTTFTANVTSAPTLSNPKDGQTINWFITQDGTGGRTMTWPTSFKWPSGASTTLSTAANSVDLVTATYRASVGHWYASLLKGFA